METQSEYVHVACTLRARLVPILHAQSVLSNKISASELRRKFIEGALLVGFYFDMFSCGRFACHGMCSVLYARFTFHTEIRKGEVGPVHVEAGLARLLCKKKGERENGYS